jgi:hypothetical protein
MGLKWCGAFSFLAPLPLWAPQKPDDASVPWAGKVATRAEASAADKLEPRVVPKVRKAKAVEANGLNAYYEAETSEEEEARIGGGPSHTHTPPPPPPSPPPPPPAPIFSSPPPILPHTRPPPNC